MAGRPIGRPVSCVNGGARQSILAKHTCGQGRTCGGDGVASYNVCICGSDIVGAVLAVEKYSGFDTSHVRAGIEAKRVWLRDREARRVRADGRGRRGYLRAVSGGAISTRDCRQNSDAAKGSGRHAEYD